MRPIQAWVIAGAMLGANMARHPQTAQAEPAQPGTPKAGTEKVPAAKGEIDPKADELLRKMSTELAAMKRFQFDASHVMEAVTKEGEKIQTVAQSSVQVQRPNKLRSDRMGPLAGVTFYYDGQNISVYGKRDNLYATAPAPDKLDAAIDFARDKLSLDAPAADLLYDDPYTALMEDAVSGKYLGLEPVGGRSCHHLAYRGNETDWQIWIEDGEHALPCRFVITSKKVKGAPEYSVAIRNWKTEPSFTQDTFAFTPPPDAGKIDFLAVANIKASQEKR